MAQNAPTELSIAESGHTHESIKGRFSDGRPLHILKRALQTGKVSVREVERIKVIRKGDHFYGRDNRRVWVFKQALPPETMVPVELVKYDEQTDDCCRAFVELRQRDIDGFDPSLTKDIVLQAVLSM
eukprot:TRINITY_DN56684_c0_g1_i1.p1 TRINITY_DN56684_c0_g1~~TRINITY_DN56684_c0_g1_i1.p1  ORF type:complete len:127 (-),score=15.23 TRINITY_DN56684_c0_g1_i1:45-425(-)